MAISKIIDIKVGDLINYLKQGVTRCVGDKYYNAEKKSIEEIYGISKAEVREIFKHPKLMNLRIKSPEEKSWNLIDDTSEETVKEEKKEETPVYGKSATRKKVTEIENSEDKKDVETSSTVENNPF